MANCEKRALHPGCCAFEFAPDRSRAPQHRGLVQGDVVVGPILDATGAADAGDHHAVGTFVLRLKLGPVFTDIFRPEDIPPACHGCSPISISPTVTAASRGYSECWSRSICS